MKISAIIINYNTWPETEKAIQALSEAGEGLDLEIILIDNGSKEKIEQTQIDRLGVKIFIPNQANLGFAKAVNQGIKISNGNFIFLVNSDVIVKREALASLAEYLENNADAGIVGPKLIYPNGSFQISAGRFPSFFRELARLTLVYKLLPFDGSFVRDFKKIAEVDWLSGGAMLIRKKTIENAGLFDENYFFGYEDIDFCFRAKKNNWKVIYQPLVKVVHYHGLSSGGKRSVFRARMEKDSLIYFFKKNRPQNILSYAIIKMFYDFKILIFKILGL